MVAKKTITPFRCIAEQVVALHQDDILEACIKEIEETLQYMAEDGITDFYAAMEDSEVGWVLASDLTGWLEQHVTMTTKFEFVE